MKILGVEIIRNHADFRLLSAEVVNTLKGFREVNIFLRGIIPYMGFHSAITYYERSKRSVGSTKYSFMKMLHFALEGITSFSVIPLRVIAVSGFLIFACSLLLSIYPIVSLLLGRAVPGWASLIMSVYILSGLTILSLGIVGEYVGKIYTEVKQRPRYIIEEKMQ